MPPERADVTVIVPAYRAAATIQRTLASIAGQTVQPREIVVVDDGSDDDTEHRANDYSDRLGGIALNVFRQVHAGAGAARNRALAEAACSYVAFLDADDEWLPEKIERSLACLRETGSDLVAHDVLIDNGDGEILFDCARHFGSARDPFLVNFLRGIIATSTVVAQRKALIDAGGFDESLPSGQDYELWIRLTGRSGASFHIFPGALTRYHVVAGSISSQIGLRRQCALRILRRHVHRLKNRAWPAPVLAWARTAIIHLQSSSAHAARRQYGMALFDWLRLPVALWSVTRAFGKDTDIAPRYFQNHDPGNVRTVNS